MIGRLRNILPQKIKYRFFVSFVCIILIPFFLLQLYYYNQTERVLVDKIKEQNIGQLSIMKSDFGSMSSLAFLHWIELERNRELIQALRGSNPVERYDAIRGEIERLRNRFMAQSAYLHYSIADLSGTLYTSYESAGLPREAEWRAEAVTQLESSSEGYMWLTDDPNYLPAGIAVGNRLLTLIGTIREEGALIGVVRISFDYEAWLKEAARNFPVLQTYYITDEEGDVMARTEPLGGIRPNVIGHIDPHSSDPFYWYDEGESILYGATTLLPQRWHIVCAFPLQFYFGDIKLMERRFFMTVLLLTGVFVLLTFFISSTVTRPLQLLKNKMEGMVRSDMKSFLPEQAYRGELSSLARTFNRMVTDMNLMVERLKREERGKEAVRFQVLISQMNPHFLLNTLNTIKWNAIEQGDETTADICKQLGLLLETSLNEDTDLIHLQGEIELVQAYMRIQQFRYEDRFTVNYEYDDKLSYVLVPKLSLQPLVDNAIVHGFPRRKELGVITVRIKREADKLVMEVQDNGQGLQHAAKTRQPRIRKGIGLANVRERLQLLFKRDTDVQLIELQHGTLARITLPFLVSNPINEREEC